MDLLPTPEQDEIVTTVRAQLEGDFDLHDLARADGADSVVDRALWSRCAELGWFGLGLDESQGGVGYGLPEEALLFGELGAHATPGPFLATVLAARLAAGAGDRELAAAVLGGEVLVGLAEPVGPGATVGATATGTFRVTDHGGADLWLLVGGDGAALLDAAAGALRPLPSIDQLVPVATATLESAAARVHVEDASALRRRGDVLVAAELAGIATATAEQSTQYAKDREQFGRPIGSFQAVKHRCADMAVRAEAATGLVRYASLAVPPDDAPPGDADFHVHAARVVAGAAAVDNARTNVQNHGGIGFTWEHTAHRYVTRAEVRSRTLGDRTDHLASLLDARSPG